MSEPSLRAAASRGIAWTVVQTWGARTVSLAAFVVLGRHLEVEAFGVMALAVTVIEFGRLLVDQGFSRYIIQRQTIDDGHLDTAFAASLVTATALTVAAVVVAGPVASAFGVAELAPVLRALSVCLVLSALVVTPSALLRRDLEFRPLAVRQLSAVLAGAVAGIATATAGAGVWALVAQQLVQNGVAVAVLWRVSAWRPGRRFSRASLREMAGFSSTSLAIEVLAYFRRRGDDLIIAAVLSPVALGFFNIAARLLKFLLDIFSSTINNVAFPVFSRLQHDPERVRRALHTATRTSSAFAFPAFAALATLAPEVIAVAFGARWAPSADVLRLLALSGLLHSVTYFNQSLLLGIGKARQELAWGAFYLVTKVLATTLTGLRWGLNGVTWAIVLHAYALAPLRVWLINRVTPINPRVYLTQFVAPLTAAIVMAGVIVGVREVLPEGLSVTVVLLAAGAAGAVAYVAALVALAPSLLRELRGDARRMMPASAGSGPTA